MAVAAAPADDDEAVGGCEAEDEEDELNIGRPGDGAALLLRLREAIGSRVARLDMTDEKVPEPDVNSLCSSVGVLLFRLSMLLLLPLIIEEYLRSAHNKHEAQPR